MAASRSHVASALPPLSRRRLLARFAGVGLAGAAGLAATACGGTIRPPDPEGLAHVVAGQAQQATGVAPPPSVLTWVTPFAPPNVGAGTPVADIAAGGPSLGWASMVSPWQTAHPNITLAYHVLPADALPARQAALAKSGDPCDVAYTDAGRDLGLAGVLDPLDVGPLGRKIVPVAFAPQSAADQVYALPVFVSALGLYVNQQRLQEVGLTPASPMRDWSSFETTARTLTTRARSLFGFDVFGSGSPRSGQARYAPFLWTAGGSFFSDRGDKAIWDEAPGLDALIYLARLSQNYATPGSATAGDAVLVNNWLTGKSAMLIAGPELIPTADERELKYNVQSVPAYIQGQASSLVTSAGAVGIFARSKHKDWGIDLVRYLASQDAQVAGLATLRLLPANADAGDAAPALQGGSALGQFLRILREDDVHSFPTPIARDAEIGEIFRAYLGVALQGLATPKVAWTKAAAEATALLKAATTPTPTPGA